MMAIILFVAVIFLVFSIIIRLGPIVWIPLLLLFFLYIGGGCDKKETPAATTTTASHAK